MADMSFPQNSEIHPERQASRNPVSRAVPCFFALPVAKPI
jgi:hypothetical protein